MSPGIARGGGGTAGVGGEGMRARVTLEDGKCISHAAGTSTDWDAAREAEPGKDN